MKREEVGATCAVGVVFALVVVVTVWGAEWLTESRYVAAAGAILTLLSGPSLVAAIALGLWMRWARSCDATRWCLRFGEHPVEDTCSRVCTTHHTKRYHLAVLARDQHKNPERLSWGESHSGDV